MLRTILEINDLDLGWLAGMIEGEGTLCRIGQTKSWTLAISSTDDSTIERLLNVIGAGCVVAYQGRKTTHKSYKVWKLTKRHQLRAVLEVVYPYMGPRRQKKIRECLDEIIESTSQ